MAIIHRTTLTPTKLEFLTEWLPSRAWYGGAGTEPSLVKAGGFRLDDPAGEVGIEFMVVTDGPAAYLVPLTYRGAPLDGAGDALVATMEHGVLGRRWAYDGCHDPVLVTQLLALIEGRVEAQAQSVSDTLDQEITRSHQGDAPIPGGFPVVVDDTTTTRLEAPHGGVLRVRRVLRPAQDDAEPPASAAGHVAGAWQAPDGRRVRGLFAVLYDGDR